MNAITKKIKIDLYSPTSYEVVIAQQGDNLSRTIEFVLYNQGEPYILPNENPEILAVIEGRRGDHSSFIKDCSIKDNVVTAELDGNILHDPGTIQAKIFLYDAGNNAVFSTIPFLISVQKDPCRKNRTEAEKSSAFDWLILQFHKLKNGYDAHAADFSNPHRVTKEQTGLGNVPNVSTNDQTPTYEPSGSLSELSAGETLSSAFGKLSKAVSILISHLADAVPHIDASERNRWNDAYGKRHTHPNQSILDSSTACYTEEEKQKLAGIETGAQANVQSDWKDSVETYDEIASAYPDPQDGWTVNVRDTDYTYRYNGTEWIAISANAIPKADSSIDGLLSKEDYIRFESMCEGAVTGVKGNAESEYRMGNINITPANIGLGNVANERQYSASNPQTNVTGSSGSCTGNSATATKLKTPRSIDGVSFDGSADITHFAVCNTAAGDTAKKIEIPNFVLKEGAVIFVKFTYGSHTDIAHPTILRVNESSDGLYHADDLGYYGNYGISLGSTRIYRLTYHDHKWIISETETEALQFQSSDTNDSEAEKWTSISALTTGVKFSDILSKISAMFKNVRYLYKLLGNTDISSLGDGTVTGILSKQQIKEVALSSPYAESILCFYNSFLCTIRILNIKNAPVGSNFTIAAIPEPIRPKQSLAWDHTTPGGGSIRIHVSPAGSLIAYRYNNSDVYNIGAVFTYAL